MCCSSRRRTHQVKRLRLHSCLWSCLRRQRPDLLQSGLCQLRKSGKECTNYALRSIFDWVSYNYSQSRAWVNAHAARYPTAVSVRGEITPPQTLIPSQTTNYQTWGSVISVTSSVTIHWIYQQLVSMCSCTIPKVINAQSIPRLTFATLSPVVRA